MSSDGFIYIFAVIGIAVTAVTSALGIAVTVTMARLTYSRLISVIPALFMPIGIVGEQRLELAPQESLPEYAEKARASVSANGRKSQPSVKDLEIAEAK